MFSISSSIFHQYWIFKKTLVPYAFNLKTEVLKLVYNRRVFTFIFRSISVLTSVLLRIFRSHFRSSRERSFYFCSQFSSSWERSFFLVLNFVLRENVLFFSFSILLCSFYVLENENGKNAFFVLSSISFWVPGFKFPSRQL